MCLFSRKKEKTDNPVLNVKPEASPDVKPEASPDVKSEASPDVKSEASPDVNPAVKHILLSGDTIDSREALFNYFRKELGEDKLIGSNLDALYDVLSTVSEETVIEVINEYHLEKSLGKTYAGLISVLLDAEKDNDSVSIKRSIS